MLTLTETLGPHFTLTGTLRRSRTAGLAALRNAPCVKSFVWYPKDVGTQIQIVAYGGISAATRIRVELRQF